MHVFLMVKKMLKMFELKTITSVEAMNQTLGLKKKLFFFVLVCHHLVCEGLNTISVYLGAFAKKTLET